jgi:hypothetical protein
MATTQGLVHFDRRGRDDGLRLGGMSGVRLLSAAPDGTVIAAVEGGQRMVRLYGDDTPAAPLSSDGNEPFRVAANWSDKACACACASVLNSSKGAGSAFLVLDETARQLWAFDPWHPGFGEKPWVKLTEPGAFTAPRLLAVGDSLAWIVDGAKLFEAHQSAWATTRAVVLPGMPDVSGLTALSSIGDDLVVAATPTTVSAYTRSADGSFALRWQSPRAFQKIVALAAEGCIPSSSRGAATASFIAVNDSGPNEVTLLSPSTGAALATVTPHDVPGGMTVGALAAQGPWVFVADNASSRLLRLRAE